MTLLLFYVWWAEIKHCKFCGLNQDQIKFTEREQGSLLKEIEILGMKYERYNFMFTDCILSKNYFNTMISKMIDNQCSYNFSVEVRSTLSKDQLIKLKKAGFYSLQPGIESLSTHILKLMDKGVKSSDNIYILKVAKDLGLDIQWNFLHGFPGETEQDYLEMKNILPHIVHLQPPSGFYSMRLDRFSPYYQTWKKDQGIYPFENVRPSFLYHKVFHDELDVERVAYFLDHDFRSPAFDVKLQLSKDVECWIDRWKDRSNAPSLIFKRGFNYGHIIDNRTFEAKSYEISEEYLVIAKALCERPMSVKSLVLKTRRDEKTILEIVDDFLDLNFVLNLDDLIVWLPNDDRVFL